MRISVDKDLLQKVANYLQEKPFKEVAGLLMDLQKDAVDIQEAEVKQNDNG